MPAQAQLGGILDGDHPLVAGDLRREDVEQRRLARTGPSTDQDVASLANGLGEQCRACGIDRTSAHQVIERSHGCAKPPNGQYRPIHRRRWDHRMKPRAIGQPGIYRRRGPIDAQPEGRNDPLHRRHHRGITGERHRAAAEHARPLHPDLVGTVDQDVGDQRIGDQRLKRAESDQFVDGAPGGVRIERRLFGGECDRHSRDIRSPQRNPRGDDPLDDATHCDHGNLQARPQAAIQRSRATGRRPCRSAATVAGLGTGSRTPSVGIRASTGVA